MNYINGIEIGGVGSSSPFAYGARHIRRLLFLWLTKVIGWSNLETSGSKWDSAQLGPLTDGATHASNIRRFSSATGGFISAMEGAFLLIKPTAAPATAGGFADPTKNGFYRINRVYDTNTIDVDVLQGVHTDGLPLSESGLNFEVHDFQPSSELPSDGDYFVVRGVGTGGNFDAKFTEDYGVNYAPTRIILSPFGDWVAGAPGSFSPGTRITDESRLDHQPFADRAWIWAVGDLTQMIVWVRYFNTAYSAQDSQFIYLGDITPFHPVQDTNPVVVVNATLGGSLDEISAIRASSTKMLGADDTTSITPKLIYSSEHANSAAGWHSGSREDRSYHSGRYARTPLIVYSNTVGNIEIRGQYKNLDHGHFNGPRGPVPFGTSRDRIRFFTQCSAPWNGSKINRYVY